MTRDPILVNLVRTMLAHGNTPANLNLARIARHQPAVVTEGDLIAEFERQMNPKIILPTQDYDGEGK